MIEQIYDSICTTNDKIIASGEPVATMIFFIKGNKSKAHTLNLTKKNRTEVQEITKRAALTEGVDGYIVVVDSMIQYKKKPETNSCIVRALYTQKRRIIEVVEYSGTTIVTKNRYTNRKDMYDAWDAWNEVDR